MTVKECGCISVICLKAKQNFLISQICKPKWTASGEISILKAKFIVTYTLFPPSPSIRNFSYFRPKGCSFNPISSVFFLHMGLFITTLQISSPGICLLT